MAGSVMQISKTGFGGMLSSVYRIHNLAISEVYQCCVYSYLSTVKAPSSEYGLCVVATNYNQFYRLLSLQPYFTICILAFKHKHAGTEASVKHNCALK